jgi:hypothetical protein
VSHEASGSLAMLWGTDIATGQTATQAWRFQNGTWSLQAGPLPSHRYEASIGYDALHQQAVLFGGSENGFDRDDTWLWNGTSWTQANPPIRPSPRVGAAMAFDHRRGVVVLFGGIATPTSTILADTWEWNGSVWQLLTPPVSPPARAYENMAFDPVNGSVLLYGGYTYNGPQLQVFNDTWTFDGNQWLQQQPATSPSSRTNAGMVTDLRRQRIVLLGGQTFDPFAWEWDGAQWSPRYQPGPGPRTSFGITYDAVARRVVVAGGGVQYPGGIYWQNDTWSFQSPLPADVAPFGSGCAGTAGTPALGAAPFTLSWLGDTMRNVVEAIPVGEPGAVFVSSVGSTPPIPLGGVGMPGCDLLVPIDVVEFRAATAGRAEWALAIPNTPSLAGATFRQQAFVLDAAANVLGLTASNAVLVTLGVR